MGFSQRSGIQCRAYSKTRNLRHAIGRIGIAGFRGETQATKRITGFSCCVSINPVSVMGFVFLVRKSLVRYNATYVNRTDE